QRATKPDVPRFRGSNKVYSLSLPASIAAFTNLNLTIAMGKKQLVVATSADAARNALSSEGKGADRWKPSADLPETLTKLPKALTYLQIEDPSDTLPSALANLPASVQGLLSGVPVANSGGTAGGAPASAPPGGEDRTGGIKGRGGRPGGRESFLGRNNG